ncbi:unnamed protein product, partial [Rotaria sordida]
MVAAKLNIPHYVLDYERELNKQQTRNMANQFGLAIAEKPDSQDICFVPKAGPIFRYDRPQAGRQRQFHQINFEYIGGDGPLVDAETINLALDILKGLEVNLDITLEVNSLGCSETRTIYETKLVEYFNDYKFELSEDSQKRLMKNPMRILDSKDESDKKIIKNSPLITQYYSNEAAKYFDHLTKYLDLLNVPYIINPRLVRGLDYYCHTAFEFTASNLGAQSTILAGGRYDNLITEVLDNAMDEAVAGFANIITIQMHANHTITISDNGRGIPVDHHPKFPNKSALEVILTQLHSGGKFSNTAYQVAGGLHGVGVSVVNALSDHLEVKVYKEGKLYKQSYSKGYKLNDLTSEEVAKKLKGTSINFHPDPEIFGEKNHFIPQKIYELAKSKAYLYRGVTIEWECEIITKDDVPSKSLIHFPNGLTDYLLSKINPSTLVSEEIFWGNINSEQEQVKIEWAITWHTNEERNFMQSYCNTIPTPLGGTHEQGLRLALLRG